MVVAAGVASEADLPILASVISENRPDVPAEDGLSASLPAGLMSQIRCDPFGLCGHVTTAVRREATAQRAPPGP